MAYTDTTSSRADIYISEVIDLGIDEEDLDRSNVKRFADEVLVQIADLLPGPGEIGEGDLTILVEVVVPSHHDPDVTGIRLTYEVSPLACAGL